jgi:hypothetical protein
MSEMIARNYQRSGLIVFIRSIAFLAALQQFKHLQRSCLPHSYCTFSGRGMTGQTAFPMKVFQMGHRWRLASLPFTGI